MFRTAFKLEQCTFQGVSLAHLIFYLFIWFIWLPFHNIHSGQCTNLKRQRTIQAMTPEVKTINPNHRNSITSRACLTSWPSAWGSSLVFSALQKANRVGAIWTSGGMLFHRTGTAIGKAWLLGPTRWHSLMEGTRSMSSLPDMVGCAGTRGGPANSKCRALLVITSTLHCAW